MAILKHEYNGWRIVTGDDDFDAEMGDQLKITEKELTSSIVALNLTDQIFNRILQLRSKQHESLLAKIPGAE